MNIPEKSSQNVSMITCTAPVNIAVIKYCKCALLCLCVYYVFCASTVRGRVALQKLCWSFLIFCTQGVNGMKSWSCLLTPHSVSLCIRIRWDHQPVHFIKGDIYKKKKTTYRSGVFLSLHFFHNVHSRVKLLCMLWMNLSILQSLLSVYYCSVFNSCNHRWLIWLVESASFHLSFKFFILVSRWIWSLSQEQRASGRNTPWMVRQSIAFTLLFTPSHQSVYQHLFGRWEENREARGPPCE